MTVDAAAVQSGAAPLRSEADRTPTGDSSPSDETSELRDRLSTCAGRWWDGGVAGYKPRAASALAVARRGWRCVQRNLLQCGSCGAYLSAGLPPPTSYASLKPEYLEAATSRLACNVIQAHEPKCVWRAKCVSEWLWCPESEQANVAAAQLEQRLQSFSTVDLAGLRTDVAPRVFANLRQLWPQLTGNDSAVHLAVTGWQRADDDQLCIAECSYCLRKVGLWLYGIADVAPAESAGDSSGQDTYFITPSKRRFSAEDATRAFDGRQYHERWCPWMQRVYVSGSDGSADTSRWLAVVQLAADQSQDPSAARSAAGSLVHARRLLQDLAPVDEPEATGESDVRGRPI